MISILLAVRNEEKTLVECLQTLLDQKLDQSYEILIGNDGSTDGTKQLLERYQQTYDHIFVYDILKNKYGLKGKANVLAQLSEKAKGSILLFTDADMRLSPTWAMTLVNALKDDVGIITGVTYVEGRTFWEKWQGLDWLYALQLLNILSSWGVALTAMGNNMGVQRKAYDAVGGYEKIPFSVAEDFALSKALIEAGWKSKHLFNRRVKGETLGVDSFQEWLRQRKRWMKGAVALPKVWVWLLVIHYLGIFLLPFVYAVQPMVSLYALGGVVAFRWGILLKALFTLRLYRFIPYILLFEPLYSVFYVIVLLYYTLPVKVVWKGREYEA
ncbi:glycosyltransferase [Algivirga pacifica]|uniref:Glycosyltransferase family 2 protein n=1 Tax=Algivirga pacifica TaxID=1162670 RepID=A0ABP9DJZ4_9BACT